MKKILFAALLSIGCMIVKKADAQVGLNVNINIGSQPDWGPVGYDRADYYYMPDIDAYYDVPAHRYVYYENNVWVRRTVLPARYSNYNVYNGYKVVVNKPRPWTNANYYRTTYATYKGRGGQPVIRDSRDVKYKDHWKGGPARPKKIKVKHDNGNHWGEGGGPGKHGGKPGKGPKGDRGNGKGHGKH
ncbi:hypothetical protein [Mucilaginibacter myungsuensis]|uniref:Uncharacterized protein n=1 Tax=Mucilaginibacter myungsuensis TaxID=649104 RepID=A0A929KY29_9SPHI|nr:hypothetical protein [Mucilaginibacter myungsuensis]MBE9663282.1 hypothetical protein [Mucilaginibacter myungsuensis]MDN3600017.1 hypothetical protein [Mucilaginibacter myungsuensis]